MSEDIVPCIFRRKSGAFAQEIKSAKDLFNSMDKNHDGRIDFDEFSNLMMDVDGRPSWFFKAAAISDQLENESW